MTMIEYGRAKGCRFLRLQWAAMRDGVRLATTVVLPEAPGRYPAVMQRTPYGRTGYLAGWEDWVKNGYALIAQDVRGRNDSEGTFTPFIQEIKDTPDTIRWIRAQEWSNGQVGMMGPSYMGWVQNYGIRDDRESLPDAMLPTFVGCHGFEYGFYHQGAFSLFLTYPWACFDGGARVSNSPFLNLFNVEDLSRRLPLETMDVEAGGGVIPFWRQLMKSSRRDEYWKQYGLQGHYHEFTMPTLIVCGWYDYYPASMIKTWNAIVANAATPEIGRKHRLILGPWGHHHGLEPTPDGKRAVDFGPDNFYNFHKIYRNWFDRCFKDKLPADGMCDRPIRLYVMGANQWRDEDEWPLARTRYVNYYLHSNGSANTRNGDGALLPAAPGTQPPDRYDYDPDKPVMTRGGNHSVGPWSDWYKELIWCGPTDQGINEDRTDMLVYTTPVLESGIEVTGPITVRLWASSSAPDTDWVVRLVDVYPDGKAINITEGLIRARFRKRNWEQPELITPGAILEYEIELQPTSNLFRAGHRIRIDITSSNFPLWDRNLNTGEDPNSSSRLAVANQTIWHDAAHPSHVILPVIP